LDNSFYSGPVSEESCSASQDLKFFSPAACSCKQNHHLIRLVVFSGLRMTGAANVVRFEYDKNFHHVVFIQVSRLILTSDR
jgi:intergrase/recombinase